MDLQRADFEPPSAEDEDFFEVVSTDGPKEETRRRMLELLGDRQLLDADELAELRDPESG